MTNITNIKSQFLNGNMTKEELDDYLMKKNEVKEIEPNIETTLGTITLPIKNMPDKFPA